jgi:hypothetical protein
LARKPSRSMTSLMEHFYPGGAGRSSHEPGGCDVHPVR